VVMGMQSNCVSPSSADSVISESDTASNGGRPRKGSRRGRRLKGTVEGLGLRGVETVNEHDWPLRGQRIIENGMPSEPPPSTDAGAGGGSPLSDDVADDQRSYKTAVSVSGKDRARPSKGAGRDSGGGRYGQSIVGMIPPLITDFDDLGSISDALMP
jgi:hypothetical protein